PKQRIERGSRTCGPVVGARQRGHDCSSITGRRPRRRSRLTRAKASEHRVTGWPVKGRSREQPPDAAPRAQVQDRIASPLKELVRTNDLVRLSWVQAVLADAGIGCVVLDQHTSLLEGSIAAIQRRVMVEERDHARALLVVAEAERSA